MLFRNCTSPRLLLLVVMVVVLLLPLCQAHYSSTRVFAAAGALRRCGCSPGRCGALCCT